MEQGAVRLPKILVLTGPWRRAGTEGGHVKYPFWSAADAHVNASAKPGQGDPNGAVFAPGEADTCFQARPPPCTRRYPFLW